MTKTYQAKITHVAFTENKIILKWLILSSDLKGQEIEDAVFKTQEQKLKNLSLFCSKSKEGDPFNAYNLVGARTSVEIELSHALSLKPQITHRKGEESKDARFIIWLSKQINPLLQNTTFIQKETAHANL